MEGKQLRMATDWWISASVNCGEANTKVFWIIMCFLKFVFRQHCYWGYHEKVLSTSIWHQTTLFKLFVFTNSIHSYCVFIKYYWIFCSSGYFSTSLTLTERVLKFSPRWTRWNYPVRSPSCLSTDWKLGDFASPTPHRYKHKLTSMSFYKPIMQ